jgi:hypothetical protein
MVKAKRTRGLPIVLVSCSPDLDAFGDTSMCHEHGSLGMVHTDEFHPYVCTSSDRDILALK